MKSDYSHEFNSSAVHTEEPDNPTSHQKTVTNDGGNTDCFTGVNAGDPDILFVREERNLYQYHPMDDD